MSLSPKKDALLRALELCGGPYRLAIDLDMHKTAVYGWVRDGQVPADRVIEVCEHPSVTYQVTPHDLRPDLYPYPTDAIPADLLPTIFEAA